MLKRRKVRCCAKFKSKEKYGLVLLIHGVVYIVVCVKS